MSFWRNDEDPPVKQTQVAITSTNGLIISPEAKE